MNASQRILGKILKGRKRKNIVNTVFEDSSLRLPFNYNAPLKSYLHSAFLSGIITEDDFPLPEVALNHHVQLFFPGRKSELECSYPSTKDNIITGSAKYESLTQVRFLPKMNMAAFKALKLIEVNRVYLRECLPLGKRTLCELITNSLNRGNYPMIFVDEFFNPSSSKYRHNHYFLHPCLILGIDPKRNRFIHPCYSNTGSFTPGNIPYSLFFKGVSSCIKTKNVTDRQVLFWELKRIGRNSGGFNHDLVRDQLLDYLSGQNNNEKYYSGPFHVPNVAESKRDRDSYFPHPEDRFGIAVYENYRNYVNRAIESGTPIDLRATRILWEHKNCILNIIEKFTSRTNRESIWSEYKGVRNTAHQFHLMALEWKIKRDPNIRKPLFKSLGTIRSKEEQVLRSLLTLPTRN